MTLLTVVQDVCAAVGVAVPQAVVPVTNSDRTMQEMLSLANELAQRIAYDTREWTRLIKSATFTGDGVWVPPQPDPLAVWTGTSAFNLPSDYKRMLLTSNVWRNTSTQQPMTFIDDADEWSRRRAAVEADAWGEWTLQGDQMLVWPIMAAAIPADPLAVPPILGAPAVKATFNYLDRNCIALNSGGYGDRFVNDADAYRLDERLLKLGMIWQWKALKGSPYAEDMGTWSDAIAIAMGADKPMPILLGRSSISFHARTAYPWQLPT